jgi:hypothetical protein
MVASGMKPSEAANELVSQLLSASNSHCSVRFVSGVFVFERTDDAARSNAPPTVYQ